MDGLSEQITHRSAAKGVVTAAAVVFRGVVAHVAALAERGEIARAIVAWVVVQVRGSEHDARHAQGCGWIDAGKARLHESQLSRGRQAADRPALAVTPAGLLLVPPYTVTQVLYRAPVRAPAVLATALGALEADQRGQFAPVDRVEPAVFARDRHGDSMSQAGQERKGKTLLPIDLLDRE
ncbi:hypothetical protein GGR39_003299 [Novosphingobium fluoreni]|uniref:Uncharacterized protein n=1 Tax=Novosphingobium fluoreni TaxID=1391222 RepID=A0A7W6C181_9SPHN|nr:hypothetical protein [Novosphingobium fluoreni]MBB3941618.1 hypothetical protein [Novosphingobium fluoreni]